MNLTQRLPLQDSQLDLESYRIHSRVEVLMLLRELSAQRAKVTLHFDGGSRFNVTSLLAVNPEFEELVFDCGSDAEANGQLLRASTLTFVTFLDQIRIQFSAHRAEPTIHGGLPALRVRMPDSVVRLQRREYYRVATPLVKPLFCEVPDPADERRTLPLRVLDLSAGGFALHLPGDKSPFSVGDALEGCSLDLPEAGRVIFNASVRSIALHARPAGLRVGCAFVRLPGHAHKLVQRQILDLERARQARSRT